MRSLRLYIGLFVFLLSSSASSFGGELGMDFGGGFKPAEDPFEPEARLVMLGASSAKVQIKIAVPDEHKLYAEKIKFAILGDDVSELKVVGEPHSQTAYDESFGREVALIKTDAVYELEFKLAPGVKAIDFELELQGCNKSMCFPPQTKRVEVVLGDDKVSEPFVAPRVPQKGWLDGSLIWVMLIAFGAGVMLSLTPCVYPLIPITVAVIGARGQGRLKSFFLSIAYVFGFALTYTLLGVIAAIGGSVFGAFASHPITIAVTGLIFLLLALSLFDVYDIELPAGLAAKLRLKRGGGLLGIILTGALSALVASPCVAAPVSGVLTYIIKTGEVLRGGLIMHALAWGMGGILILAGTFSGLMQKLPKAGGWMKAIKMTLGVVLVIAALYYARTILVASLFNVWVVVVLAVISTVLIIVGRKLSGENFASKLARGLGVVGILASMYFAFGAAARGGVDVGLLRGTLPEHILQSRSLVKFRVDWEDALKEATLTSRPVMLKFVQPNCAGCRELEEKIFSSEIFAKEAARFVAVKIDLADKNPTFDRSRFGVVGAPTVVWIDSSGKLPYNYNDLKIVGSDISLAEFVEIMRKVR